MSPRAPHQNEALREATREKLMQSALRLFGRQGYASTTVSAIARDAGVSQGLLYSHFSGKEELLRALLSRNMEEVRGSFAVALGRGAAGSAAGRGEPSLNLPPLERLIRAAFAAVDGNLSFWRLSYGMRMQQPVLEVLGPDLGAWTREIRETLEKLFREAGSAEPALEAELLFAAIDGVAQHYALEPERFPLGAVTDALVARFVPGGEGGRAGEGGEGKPEHKKNARYGKG